MEPVPSLREVFAALAGGSANPADALLAAGHGDLPGDLVAEAIVNYADAAPIEVAEHLSPFVVAHSAVPQDQEPSEGGPDTHDGLDLLTGAPTGDHETGDHDIGDHDTGVHDTGLDGGLDDTGLHDDAHGHDSAADSVLDGGLATDATDPDASHPVADHDPADLFFGAGDGPGDEQADAAAAHPADPGFDPAALDAPADHDPSWLDLTSSSSLDAPAGAGEDWTHVQSHDADGGHDLPSDVDDDPTDHGPLHGGAA